jgi:NTP pyrophosphatase (non-canonical NTP hydrolase)
MMKTIKRKVKEIIQRSFRKLTFRYFDYEYVQTHLGYWSGPFINAFYGIQRHVYLNAVNKGLWDKVDDAGNYMHIMSEVSEAFEACRKDVKSEKIPGFTLEEEELADVVIMIMSRGQKKGLRIPEAVLKKMNFNHKREKLHGKKF